VNGDPVVLGTLARLLGPLARRDEPLGARTTYRVGGRAALWVEASDEAALSAVHRALVSVGEPVPVLVVGKGSNLLVADAGFPGLALALGDGFDTSEIDGTTVRAGGARALPVLARQTAAAGLRGLEWAVGVPGSVGGALRMNAGGHGSDTAKTLAGYRLFDLRTGTCSWQGAAAFGGAYRRSSLGPADIGIAADFALERGDAEEARALVSEIVRWRRAHQPGGSNAGSVFTNPLGAAAAELVERCGLKGRRLGTAQVSPKHANFIQADEGGSADDVRRLVDLVRAEVADKAGVELVPELHMAGFADGGGLVVEAVEEPSTSIRGRG
jgi:UDP-N-acetylmuramate dehydrogenase